MTQTIERLPLAPGYTIRAARPEDITAVRALTAASDLEEFGEAEGYTLEELQDDWNTVDLDRDVNVVIAPGGELVGYAFTRDRQHIRVDVEGYVHPSHYGRGIGTTLVRLSEERAREHVPLAPDGSRVILQNWINGQNAAACSLLEREGFAPWRYFLRMECELGDEQPAPEWPDGIEVRTFQDGDEQVYYDTSEEAMADHWGFVATDFDAWKQRHLGSTFDPSLWFLATEGGTPAAISLCSVADGIGWVDTLGVRRPWRQHGLGMALLRHSARELQRRGLKRMALGVDAASPTGATRLYERAGMHVAQKHATYGKELRPGAESATSDPGD